ncbi:hypothetical protein BS78_06G016600 [Paspalum vaginatum]|nr:hypothetical protein BS78_06G016600 [Paspalum vaginatum]
MSSRGRGDHRSSGQRLHRNQFSCGVCHRIICDHAFTCAEASYSTLEVCRLAFCSGCQLVHNHRCCQVFWLDSWIETAVFVCPACSIDVPSQQFNSHMLVCSHRTLPCPIWAQNTTSSRLKLHLQSVHNFSTQPSNNGSFVNGVAISKTGG